MFRMSRSSQQGNRGGKTVPSAGNQRKTPARRPVSQQPSKRSVPNTQPRFPGREYDRYHYVEPPSQPRRSTPQSRKAKRKRQQKRKQAGRRALLVMASLVLVVVAIAVGASTWIFSQLHREEVNTEQYEEQPSDAPAWTVANADGVMNILLIGADRNKDGSNGRSDTMMLVSIDQKNKKFRLVSFMRDMYLDIPTVGYERLNATFAYGGAALTMQTIENYFRVSVDKYVQTDFDNFEKIISKMGGVDVELSKEEAEFMNRKKGWTLQEGVQHLNAEEALYFSRIRDLDSDFGRTGRQRQMILCMLETFKKLNVTDMAAVVLDYLPYVTTNLSNEDILGLASLVTDFSSYEVETMHVPDTDTYEDVLVELNGVPGNQVMKPDVEENARRLKAFLYGEDASTES